MLVRIDNRLILKTSQDCMWSNLFWSHFNLFIKLKDLVDITMIMLNIVMASLYKIHEDSKLSKVTFNTISRKIKSKQTKTTIRTTTRKRLSNIW